MLREAKFDEERSSISEPTMSLEVPSGFVRTYPSSTVHAICAPAIEILRVMRSHDESWRFVAFVGLDGGPSRGGVGGPFSRGTASASLRLAFWRRVRAGHAI
jgi:hypothetical protein